MNSPTAQEIRSERERIGATIEHAAAAVHVTSRAWSFWEAGSRAMPPGLWELFLLKTGRRSITKR